MIIYPELVDAAMMPEDEDMKLFMKTVLKHKEEAMGEDLTKDFTQGATGSIRIGDREVGEVKELAELPPLPEGKAPLELGGSGVIKAKLRHKRKKKYGYIKKSRRKELRKKKLFKRYSKGSLRIGDGRFSVKRKK